MKYVFLFIGLALVVFAVWIIKRTTKEMRCPNPHCGALAVKHTGHIWRCEKCGQVKQRLCHVEGCKGIMKEHNERGVWKCPKCQATSEWHVNGESPREQEKLS